jgi:hypothetical protein
MLLQSFFNIRSISDVIFVEGRAVNNIDTESIHRERPVIHGLEVFGRTAPIELG